MKKIKRWIKEHKVELRRTYMVGVTTIAILGIIGLFNCGRIIEENNLQDYFYTSDLPAEEF